VETLDPVHVTPVLARARQGGGEIPVPSPDAIQQKLSARGRPTRLLVIGGDEGRKPTERTLHDLGQRLGFQAIWLFVGARPALKTLRDLDPTLQQADAVLVHHLAGPELRDEMRRLGAGRSIPVREATWLGTRGIEAEVLQTLAALA
jgi:hypothetical protein